MKKKKQQKPLSQQKDDKVTLSSMISSDIFAQLKNKQRELVEIEQKEKEAAEKKKIEDRRRAEKNKSFAELLQEDNKDWRNFK
ncbi:YqkE family protein [Bacillus sp. JJ722]|uniref:YqkE family protein n=1 Tax=Bacillus sp. JJ722 TaxID=3122973 RepID=UPI00300017C9